MKKIIHSLVMCLSPCLLNAQKIQVSELSLTSLPQKATLYNFTTSSDKSVSALLVAADNTLILDRIDSTGQVSHLLSIKPAENIKILQLLPAPNGKTAVVFSQYMPNKKSLACYYSLIEMINHPDSHLLLDESYPVEANNSGRYQVTVSNDNQCFALVKEHAFERGKNEQISISVYSIPEIKKIWSRNYVLDVLSRINPINVYHVNSKGEVYAVKKEQDKTTYKYILYCFHKESSANNSRTFNLPGKFISDIIATTGNKGDFILAGYYSAFNYTDYEGYFIYRFNNSMQMIARQLNALGSAMLSDIIGKKAASKEGASLSGFMLEHIVQRTDGGFYLLSEKHQVYKDKNGKDRVLDEDIFILSLDASGNALGTNLLKKKQETAKNNETYSSYNYWLHRDSLNIIYNKINFDEQGKKLKADEYGENNFAGTSWYYLNNKCELKKNQALTGLFKDSNKPMAINVLKIHTSLNNKIILLADDFGNTLYKYLAVSITP